MIIEDDIHLTSIISALRLLGKRKFIDDEELEADNSCFSIQNLHLPPSYNYTVRWNDESKPTLREASLTHTSINRGDKQKCHDESIENNENSFSLDSFYSEFYLIYYLLSPYLCFTFRYRSDSHFIFKKIIMLFQEINLLVPNFYYYFLIDAKAKRKLRTCLAWCNRSKQVFLQHQHCLPKRAYQWWPYYRTHRFQCSQWRWKKH